MRFLPENSLAPLLSEEYRGIAPSARVIAIAMVRTATPPDFLARSGAAEKRLSVRLLGRIEIRDELGRSLLPRGRKTRALLGVLALSTPRPVLRDLVSGLLWSRREREQAQGSLRQAVHELQQHLRPFGGDVLRAERTHLRLDPAGVAVDVHALAGAAAGAGLAALDRIEGPLMEDLEGLDPAFDRWLGEERRRVMTRAVALAEAVLACADDPGSLGAAAERLLAMDRSHEGAWRALIGAHLRSGHRAGAVAFDPAPSGPSAPAEQ